MALELDYLGARLDRCVHHLKGLRQLAFVIDANLCDDKRRMVRAYRATTDIDLPNC